MSTGTKHKSNPAPSGRNEQKKEPAGIDKRNDRIANKKGSTKKKFPGIQPLNLALKAN